MPMANACACHGMPAGSRARPCSCRAACPITPPDGSSRAGPSRSGCAGTCPEQRWFCGIVRNDQAAMLPSGPERETSTVGSMPPSTDASRTRNTVANVPADGLTDDEARRRLRDDGPNEIAAAERHGIFRTLLGVLHEPMLVLLAMASALYLVLGDPAA